MPKLLPLVFSLAMILALPGCSLFHKKEPVSASHLYEGNAPTIHYSDKPETAGGEIHPY